MTQKSSLCTLLKEHDPETTTKNGRMTMADEYAWTPVERLFGADRTWLELKDSVGRVHTAADLGLYPSELGEAPPDQADRWEWTVAKSCTNWRTGMLDAGVGLEEARRFAEKEARAFGSLPPDATVKETGGQNGQG